MPAIAKLLIGFAAALLAGWVAHGPLGRGAAFIDSVQAQAEAVIRTAGLPGVTVSFPRDPLSRTAWLSGPANDLQRNGQGGLLGLNQRVAAVPGVAAVRWTDENSSPGGIPLLAETLPMVAFAFLIGLGLGRLFFRPKRTSFL
ncbi:hypothetical protein [Sphingosinicella sp.]|uniref:hypothetical protein n=1 Tax=Sphingosinicella sp. TaxID=1917971 RepID=UPI0040378F0F